MTQCTLICSIPSKRKFGLITRPNNWFINSHVPSPIKLMDLYEPIWRLAENHWLLNLEGFLNKLNHCHCPFKRPNEENILWRRERKREANPASLSRVFPNLNVHKLMILTQSFRQKVECQSYSIDVTEDRKSKSSTTDCALKLEELNFICSSNAFPMISSML